MCGAEHMALYFFLWRLSAKSDGRDQCKFLVKRAIKRFSGVVHAIRLHTMDMRFAICVVTLLIVACREDSVTPEDLVTTDDLLVYADREVRQCESDGISPEASAQILINAGVDVINSTCGIRTGVEYPAVCGGATGDILVHEIRSVNLPDAEQLGFQAISTLIDEAAGTNYELVDCADRFASG